MTSCSAACIALKDFDKLKTMYEVDWNEKHRVIFRHKKVIKCFLWIVDKLWVEHMNSFGYFISEFEPPMVLSFVICWNLNLNLLIRTTCYPKQWYILTDVRIFVVSLIIAEKCLRIAVLGRLTRCRKNCDEE